MRDSPIRAGGCCVVAVVLTVSAAPLAVAQPEQRAAAPSAHEDLVRLAQELREEVEALRGWKFKHAVKTGVCSERQLREFVEKKVFEEEYGPGELACVEAFLRMVGLIPADCDLRQTILDVLLNQIGGFYDPKTKSFHMLSRSDMDYGPLVERIMIVHELTHALDDQYVDLDRLMKLHGRTEDWTLTIGAIVEGSATVLMSRYSMQAIQSGRYDASQLWEVLKREEERSRAFIEAPPYFSSLFAVYICGMSFLTEGRAETPVGGAAIRNVGKQVLEVAKDPPVSTEQILHPRKYWVQAERDYPVEVADADVERLVERLGLHVTHKDRVGELLCAVLTTDESRSLNLMLASLPTYWTNEAASGWGGDRFFLLAEGRDVKSAREDLKGLKGVWITLWDTTDDRDEFVEDYELERELPSRSVFTLGARGAVFLFGFDQRQRQVLQRRFERTLPAFTKDGRPWSVGKR